MQCAQHRCCAFAMIVAPHAARSARSALHKDYAFLFERFYYYVNSKPGEELGLVVFDEKDKSQNHILIDQMSRYFQDNVTGKSRSATIVPEPFFVHSDLTTMIQVADLIAYIISWGLRIPYTRMVQPARNELKELADLVRELGCDSSRLMADGRSQTVYSFYYIEDLRPMDERAPSSFDLSATE